MTSTSTPRPSQQSHSSSHTSTHASPGCFVYADIPKAQLNCPVCESPKFTTLCNTDRYLMGLATARCDSCGLIMTNPAPTAEALGEFYSTHYRYYYRKLERPDLSYIHRYDLDHRARYTTDFLIDQKLLRDGARVLDVGCGEGSILREIHHRRPDVAAHGVEPYVPFAQFAASYSQCEILGDLNDVPAGAEHLYDLVILSHVLEHILSPVEFLARLATFLKPGGKIFVDVPDVCRYHWLADLHIGHIYHFSPRTLSLAGQKAALTVNVLQTHKPPKLPSCIRTILAREGPVATLPDTQHDEDAAAARIAKMSRNAGLFSLCFRFCMGFYEWSWLFLAHLPANRRPVE